MTPLARSAKTNPFWKLNFEVQKFRIPDETGEVLTREAASLGMSLTEFVRSVLMVRAHGLESVLSVERERLMSVAGIGSESDV